MRRSVARRCRQLAGLAVVTALVSACGEDGPPPLPPPNPPQVEGTLTLSGLAAPVTVRRDRHGIPHITAASADDLFFAQGFVQAQDRLFQMDLWRRSAQGRLAEVLGANFLERDAMTRRIQYRGNLRAEWASYGDDVEQTVNAFVRGINAVVAEARINPPDEFRLAGWLPEAWKPEDLLTRTPTFLAASGAHDEVLRARLMAALGAARVDAMWPTPGETSTRIEPAVDFSVIGPVLGNMLRRVGTRPFLAGLAAPLTLPPGDGASANPTPTRAPLADTLIGGLAFAVPPARTAAARPLIAVAPHRTFDNPASRYLVHLTAPGWNVIGATSPWLPGVVIGHNDDVAWGMALLPVDVQDLTIERLHPDDPHRVARDGSWSAMDVQLETVPIKGRAEPFEFERQSTDRGVIVGVDRERGLAYALQWPGSEPGTASELAALTLGRARSLADAVVALERWKAPIAEFVIADRSGRIARQTAGIVPDRSERNGRLPSAGWTGVKTPTAWIRAPQHTVRQPPPNRLVVAPATDDVRTSRLTMRSSAAQSIETVRALLADTRALDADVLVPLLQPMSIPEPRVDALRRRLLAWDRELTPGSTDALSYMRWKQAALRGLVTTHVPKEFVDEVARRVPLSVIAQPTRAWFDAPVSRRRDALLIQALAEVATPGAETAFTWGDSHRLAFVHPLAISEQARRVFNVGPVPMPGGPDALVRTSDDLTAGSSFRAIFDVGDWDNAIAMNAPGQSGSPLSAHYADLARLWAAGEYITLPFSAEAVREATASMLMLTPR